MHTTWPNGLPADAEEGQVSSDDSELLLNSREMRPGSGNHRAKYVMAGLVTLVACAILTKVHLLDNSQVPISDDDAGDDGHKVAFTPPAPAARAAQSMTARALLESEDLADVATDQILNIGHESLDYSHRSAVRALVVEGFRNVTLGMQTEDPEGYKKFSEMQLTEEQGHAVLHALTHMLSPKVVNVGIQVARGIQQGKDQGKEGARRMLMEKLQPKMPQIASLRDQVIPLALRQGEDPSKKWNMVIEPNHLYLMKNFPSKWKMEFEMGRSDDKDVATHERRLVSQPLLRTEQAFGIMGAITEQGRMVLDMINFINPSFKNSFKIPRVVTGAVGGVDLVTNLLPCLLDGFGGSNPQLLLVCPFRFASAASDMFKLIHSMMSRFFGPASSSTSSYPFHNPMDSTSYKPNPFVTPTLHHSTSYPPHLPSSSAFFQPVTQPSSSTTQKSLWPW